MEKIYCSAFCLFFSPFYFLDKWDCMLHAWFKTLTFSEFKTTSPPFTIHYKYICTKSRAGANWFRPFVSLKSKQCLLHRTSYSRPLFLVGFAWLPDWKRKIAFQPHHVPTVWPQPSYFASLNFLRRKLEIKTVASSYACCKNWMRSCLEGTGHSTQHRVSTRWF